jgi:long-chain acyl-CoA synthetase
VHVFGTHRTWWQRLRLTTRKDLGAGNFFWHACDVADDLDRPLLHRIEDGAIRGHSLKELRGRVLRYVNWYRDHGVEPGSRVAVYTTDGLAGLLHHIAVTSLGGATVLTNPKMAPATAAHYFDRADSGLLVADTDLLAAVGWHGPAWAIEVVAAEATNSAAVAGHPYANRDDDLVLVSHSSGTTGVPKPTSFAHRTFAAGKRERLWNFPSARSDRLVTALPPSHSAGVSYLSLAVLLGLPTLMCDDPSGAAVARAMNAFLPTVVIGFPISLADLPVDDLSEPAKQAVHTWMGMGDASHERHIRPLLAVGRRPGPRGTWRAGSTYVDGLGSSEMGMVLFKNTHTPETEHFGRMIGRPVRVVESAAALDRNGVEVPVGEAGLLGVRTPSVTPGYVNDPDLTEGARVGGYFLTGDIVRRDANGDWYHLDRTPDVITTADGPVYSLPLEEVVLNETFAFDAAVFAVDSVADDGTSEAAAVVLFKDGAGRDADTLLRRCNRALDGAGIGRLAALVVAHDREELPVGVTGKVLKRVLRERHRSLLTAEPSADVAIEADRAVDDRRLAIHNGHGRLARFSRRPCDNDVDSPLRRGHADGEAHG